MAKVDTAAQLPGLHELYAEESHIVICRADTIGRRKGPYVLATRQVFTHRTQAAEYAATVSPSRQPIIVAGRWHQLRGVTRG